MRDYRMGYSVRHTPVVGYGKSEKRSKVAAHRKLRRKTHALEHDPTVEVYPVPREVSNTRRWRKSPRGWCEDMVRELPELMRK